MRLDVPITIARLFCRGRGSLVPYTANSRWHSSCEALPRSSRRAQSLRWKDARPLLQTRVVCDSPLQSSLVSNSSRQMATVSHSMYAKVPDQWCSSVLMLGLANPDAWGPLNEYDERVHSHQLREDEHQRGTHSLSEHLLISTVPIDLLD